MSLVVGSVTFDDCPVGFTGTAGSYWRGTGNPGMPKSRIQDIYAPTVSGAGEKRHKFEKRELSEYEIIYVDTSADACWGAHADDAAAMYDVANSVIVGGVTYPACEVTAFDVIKGPKKTSQNGMYRMHCKLSMKQKRLS